MRKYVDFIEGTDGKAAVGASVRVLNYPAGTVATIYQDANASIPIANPITTDSTGGFSFYAFDGRYSFEISGRGLQAKTISDVSVFDEDGKLAVADMAASSGASLVGFLQSGTAPAARTLQDKGRDWVSLADFAGADPTGATSSVTALTNALGTGKTVVLFGGTWKLDSAITVANLGRQRIVGVGGATLSVNLAASTDVFTMNGPVGLENLTVDFNNGPCRYFANYAANVGHVVLRDLKVQNLKDTDNTTGSIALVIVPTGNTFDIKGIRFSSMLKKGNGVITDANGSLNCIYVGGGTGSTQGSIRDVYASAVHNIDATNAVIYEDTAVIYIATDSADTANRIVIDNVHGSEFGKRLIKNHASNVTISNVVGYSTEGDSTGVIGFLTGQGLGEKYGCSASNCRALGNMESAFSSSAPGVKWKNLMAYTTPGTKAGMSNASFGLLVSSDDTEVIGYESGSERHIGLGSSTQIVRNTSLRNLKLVYTAGVLFGITNVSTTTGFDGLKIEGARLTVDGTYTGDVPIGAYVSLNGTTIKGRNVTLRDVTVESAGPLNASGALLMFSDNVTVEDFRYFNTSGLSHFRLVDIESCSNVKVDGVLVEGTNQIGVFLKDCTGRNNVSRVQNPSATVAAVYNNNSAGVRINDCDPAKVNWATINPAVNGTLIGSKTFDPPSLAAGATQQTAVTVTGAVIGMRAHAMFSSANADILWLASVTAADTVTVTQWNRGVAAFDHGSGTLKAIVFNE